MQVNLRYGEARRADIESDKIGRLDWNGFEWMLKIQYQDSKHDQPGNMIKSVC